MRGDASNREQGGTDAVRSSEYQFIGLTPFRLASKCPQIGRTTRSRFEADFRDTLWLNLPGFEPPGLNLTLAGVDPCPQSAHQQQQNRGRFRNDA
jgi:hypothetical protein